VRIDALEQARAARAPRRPLAGLEAVEALQRGRSVLVDARLRREDVDLRQGVALPDFVVVEIMRGGDLDAACAELRIDIVESAMIGISRSASGRRICRPIRCR
jgi:hypothetical protein